MDWQIRENTERYDPHHPVDWCWNATHRIVDEHGPDRDIPGSSRRIDSSVP